jgi:hypothetical protein
MKGDLLLLLPGENGRGAEPSFQQAFDVARDLDARMMQLRAALGLFRAQGKRDAQRGKELLSAVYATFTEGFTTPDLVDAATLLENVPRDDSDASR